LELTPEERQRIFEEEEIRVEARTQIETAQEGQVLQPRRASRRKPSAKRIILFSGLALALLAVVAWRVRLTLTNHARAKKPCPDRCVHQCVRIA